MLYLLLRNMSHVTKDCGLTITNRHGASEEKFSILLEIIAPFCMSYTAGKTILVLILSVP